MKKTTFAIIVFLVAFAIPMAVYTLFFSDQSTNDARIRSEEDENHAPVIHSVPSTSAYIGEEYTYRVRASDADGDRLEYQLKRFPLWMEWDEELMTVRGTPSKGDVGSDRVEIWVTDGIKVNTQIFEVDVSAVPESDTDTGLAEEGNIEEVIPQNPGDANSENVTNNSEENLSAYGLADGGSTQRGGQSTVAQATPSQNTGGTVLGTMNQLPNTAITSGYLVVAIGSGILAVALFFWADGRWNIAETLISSVDYARGRQVKMQVESGIIVKKKKHSI